MTLAIVVAALVSGTAQAERIKDIADIEGVRTNQLVGYGLIVGLDGTGDQTTQAPFTTQSLKSMLARLGVNVPADVNPQIKNVAAVALHAQLPPFSKPGQTIDITVASIGNAKSLRGGSLLASPMRGVDGQVYAIAQGNVFVGGFGVGGDGGSSVTVNVPSSGRIPNGATVERQVPASFERSGVLTLNLHTADFTTVQRVVEAIDQSLGRGVATAVDATSIRVRMPADPAGHVAYVSTVENLTVEPGSSAAKVIVNARTGTVVIGQQVRVLAAAVSHGNISVTVASTPSVSQPNAFAQGAQTVTTAQTDIDVVEERNPMFLFEPGVSLEDIVRAVNEVGASPGDLVSILQALKAAGALRAQLIII